MVEKFHRNVLRHRNCTSFPTARQYEACVMPLPQSDSGNGMLFSMCSYWVSAKVVLSIGPWVSSHLVSIHGLRIRVVKTLPSRRNLPQISEELRHTPSDGQARLPAEDVDGTRGLASRLRIKARLDGWPLDRASNVEGPLTCPGEITSATIVDLLSSGIHLISVESHIEDCCDLFEVRSGAA